MVLRSFAMSRLHPFLSSGTALLIALSGWAPSAQAQPAADAGVSLRWQIPSVDSAQTVDGTTALTLPGFETLKRPGQPEVPFSSELIALPPGSDPVLEIVASTSHRETLSAPLPIACCW